jgi:hypothetical protein
MKFTILKRVSLPFTTLLQVNEQDQIVRLFINVFMEIVYSSTNLSSVSSVLSSHLLQPPEEMFYTAEYSAWDATTGIPTHNAKGEEITKSQSKKLAKLQEAYGKKYDKWLQQQQQA